MTHDLTRYRTTGDLSRNRASMRTPDRLTDGEQRTVTTRQATPTDRARLARKRPTGFAW